MKKMMRQKINRGNDVKQLPRFGCNKDSGTKERIQNSRFNVINRVAAEKKSRFNKGT